MMDSNQDFLAQRRKDAKVPILASWRLGAITVFFFLFTVHCVLFTSTSPAAVSFSLCGRDVTNHLYGIPVSNIWGLTSADIRYPGWSWTQQTNSAAVPRSIIVCSSNFQRMASIVRQAGTPQYMYVSADSGATWVSVYANLGYLYGVAMSADGLAILAAYSGNGSQGIRKSSNGGINWSFLGAPLAYDYAATNYGWNVSISMSDDKQKIIVLAATGGSSQPYYGSAYSLDGGISWSLSSQPMPFGISYPKHVSSPNGQFMVGHDNNGNSKSLYGSADYGQNWSEYSAPGQRIWKGSAISSNGNCIAAVADTVWITTNGGFNWASCSESATWNAIAMSADGKTLLAAEGYNVWASYNSGASWISVGPSGNHTWTAIAMKPDGKQAVLGCSGISTNVWTGVFQ